MPVPLNDLLQAIGASIQSAQNYLEYTAITAYFGYFKTADVSKEEGENAANDGEPDTFMPITKTIALPSTEQNNQDLKSLTVPLAALSQHSTMKLDTVTVRLNAIPSVDPSTNALLLEVGPTNEEPGNADTAIKPSELELVFRSAPCSEGISRLNQNNISQF